MRINALARGAAIPLPGVDFWYIFETQVIISGVNPKCVEDESIGGYDVSTPKSMVKVSPELKLLFSHIPNYQNQSASYH